MSTETTNYNLIKPSDNDAADIGIINTNMDILDSFLKGLDGNKEAILSGVEKKCSIVEDDFLPLLDSEDSVKTKKISFRNVRAALKMYFDTLYNKTIIENNLTTSEAGCALDAVQGKVISDYISDINTALINQAKAENISVTSTTQTLYGAANVDEALQRIFLTGSIIWYTKNTPPAGCLVCNGSAISRTTYSNLFNVIGTMYGTGNGSTTFHLPDLRGAFIRGIDMSKGQDTGRLLGSVQSGTVYSGMSYTTTSNWPSGQFISDNFDTGTNGKIRPYNIALLPCIKY